MQNVPCPCCGFLTLGQEYGSYVVCPVCEWEDDGIQLANPTSGGGANSCSLAEAQIEMLEKYPAHVEVAEGFRRSRRWRPLSAVEIQRANSLKVSSHWSKSAVLAEAAAYWSASQSSAQ
jgi:hypothetical protein